MKRRLMLVTLVLVLLSACGSLPGNNLVPGSVGTTSSSSRTTGSTGAASAILSTAGTNSTSNSATSTTGQASLSEATGTTSTAGATGISSSGPVPAPYNAFPFLPNPGMSPGDTLAVTSADICVSGYSKKVRNVPQSEKDQVYKEYGITSHAPNSYEVDHLISLELGGSNSIKNLWPESYTGDWNAHVKDKLENKLHSLVCAGTVDLKTAQHAIATNWIAAYLKYIGQP